jgi:hypothetical protein
MTYERISIQINPEKSRHIAHFHEKQLEKRTHLHTRWGEVGEGEVEVEIFPGSGRSTTRRDQRVTEDGEVRR